MGGWKRCMEEKEAGTNYLQKNLSLCIWVESAPPIPPIRVKPASANLDHNVDKVIPITLTKRHTFPVVMAALGTLLRISGVSSKSDEAQCCSLIIKKQPSFPLPWSLRIATATDEIITPLPLLLLSSCTSLSPFVSTPYSPPSLVLLICCEPDPSIFMRMGREHWGVIEKSCGRALFTPCCHRSHQGWLGRMPVAPLTTPKSTLKGFSEKLFIQISTLASYCQSLQMKVGQQMCKAECQVILLPDQRLHMHWCLIRLRLIFQAVTLLGFYYMDVYTKGIDNVITISMHVFEQISVKLCVCVFSFWSINHS